MDKNLSEIADPVLAKAAGVLRSMGLHCTFSSVSLPQGLTVSLHVGESQQAVVAAYVAQGRGGAQAHTKGSAESFSAEVAEMLVEVLAEAEMLESTGWHTTSDGASGVAHYWEMQRQYWEVQQYSRRGSLCGLSTEAKLMQDASHTALECSRCQKALTALGSA